MPTECTNCHDSIIHDEDSIVCSTCTSVFHFFCAGYNENAFKKLSNNSKMRFVCNKCKTIGSGNKSKLPDKINDENVISKKKLEELITSVNFMGNQFDDFSIPKTVNENWCDIVQVIAKKSNSNIMIKSAYRIHSSDNKTNIIVAELETSDMRKDFLSKVKSLRLNANMIHNSWSTDSKIYVNERLTKNRRTLFSKTRLACKEKRYKYVWVNNAEILVKKDDGEKTLRIKSDKDIKKL
ncbi:uncharacterized protein LOC103309197 [Acyrthosiphon pisum]|uniref:Zinc finger PHD-type domain-containing protein n=1 Tax=Acyrthosiphon pisum TaxID=7029 RepID=A0A8R2F7T3_ACYPI|nr:uncharacterized protein LOC103309197 [Acyrthosiphon pisum]|eukprot:XP_008182276.1 PREDICTED: uncharacterized protein LOC103309197 [Acyrthosiphon pisum]